MQQGPDAAEDAVHMLLAQQQVELDKIRTILSHREERLNELLDEHRVVDSEEQGNEEMQWAQAPVGCVSTGTTRRGHGTWDRLQEVGLGGSTSKASVSMICPSDTDKSSYFLGITSPRVLNNVCVSGEARLELLGVQLLDVQLTGQTLDHMIRREVKLKQDVYKSNVHISQEVEEIATEFERVQAEYLQAEMEQKRAQRELSQLQHALEQKREMWQKMLEPWRNNVARIEREQVNFRARREREIRDFEARKDVLHAKIRTQDARLFYNEAVETAGESAMVNQMLAEHGNDSPSPRREEREEEEEEEEEEDLEDHFDKDSSMDAIKSQIQSGFAGMNEVSKVSLLETTYKKLLEAKSRQAMLAEERAVSETKMEASRKVHAELKVEYDDAATNFGMDSVSRLQEEEVDSKLRLSERNLLAAINYYEDVEKRYQPVRNGLKQISERVDSAMADGGLEVAAVEVPAGEDGEPADPLCVLLEQTGENLMQVAGAVGFDPDKHGVGPFQMPKPLTTGKSLNAGENPYNIRALDSAGKPLSNEPKKSKSKK